MLFPRLFKVSIECDSMLNYAELGILFCQTSYIIVHFGLRQASWTTFYGCSAGTNGNIPNRQLH